MDDKNKINEKEEDNEKIVSRNLRIPKRLLKELEKTAKKNYRSLNSELLTAVETYLTDWKNKH
jgi:Arc-like DNA binding domain